MLRRLEYAARRQVSPRPLKSLLILGARVPLLKLTMPDGLEIDVR